MTDGRYNECGEGVSSQSIFRRSGDQFADDNATKQRISRMIRLCDRIMLGKA
jgi:hypothetical protein